MSTSSPKSLLYCPYILLSVQAFSRSSLTFLLEFSFVSHPSFSITFVLATCCGYTLFCTYHPKLFSSALIHPSNFISVPFSTCFYILLQTCSSFELPLIYLITESQGICICLLLLILLLHYQVTVFHYISQSFLFSLQAFHIS